MTLAARAALGMLLAFLAATSPLHAQEPAAPGAPIAVAPPAATDAAIRDRIDAIFAELPELSGVEVEVTAGVVALSGVAPSAAAVDRGEQLAARVEGVTAVRNAVARDATVDTRLAPAMDELRRLGRGALAFAPAALIALVVAALFAWAGGLLSRRRRLWRRVTPNAFIADLAARTVQLVFVAVGVVVALIILDATAVLGAALAAVGVIGLAVGFAVRDTIENYLASVMLSIRQPFRPNDHVVINGEEGRVLRLTSRATILMTLEGNHLRIPNAEVFKAVILNYTLNPQRRFSFELGVGADDEPLAAIETGIAALGALEVVLDDPPPMGAIEQIGDSNIVIAFHAWIDQREADFLKSRSIALAATKAALEDGGYSLPEPIYRIRMDTASGGVADAFAAKTTPEPKSGGRPSIPPAGPTADARPDRSIDRMVAEERTEARDDLLSDGGALE